MSVFTVELWETAGRLQTGLFGAPCTSPIVRALYPILIVGWPDGHFCRRPSPRFLPELFNIELNRAVVASCRFLFSLHNLRFVC